MFVIFHVFQQFYTKAIEMSELTFHFSISMKWSQYRNTSYTVSTLECLSTAIYPFLWNFKLSTSTHMVF